jgi:hypothetical protein
MSKLHGIDVRAIHRGSSPECCRAPDRMVAREHWATNRTDARGRRLVAGFLGRLRGHGGDYSVGTYHEIRSRHHHQRSP